VGAAILLLFALEAASFLSLSAAHRLRGEDAMPARVGSSAYENFEEVDAYFRELRQVVGARFRGSSPMLYSPYEIWKNRDFSGKHINIENGVRRTLYSEEAAAGVRTIFFLGGSTMWGDGVPDRFTIPSLVAKKLNEQATEHEAWTVRNFGERAYCIHQELIRLMRLLEGKDVPDVVIFLDGINEAGAAYQNDRAGDHYDVKAIRRQLSMGFERRIALGRLLRSSSTYRMWSAWWRSGRKRRGEELSHERMEILAKEVCDSYLASVGHARLIAQGYGFETLFLWQPFLDETLKATSGEEREIVERPWRYGLTKGNLVFAAMVYEEMRRRIRNGVAQGIVDVSGVFRDHPETLFVDPYHVGPEGNDIMAERIVEELRRPS
jgi:lysophospholipase L1-like esterase